MNYPCFRVIAFTFVISICANHGHAQEIGDRVVAKKELTLRVSKKPIETVGRDTQLKVESKNGTWLWVKSPAGKKGWVRAADVEILPEDIPPDAPPDAPPEPVLAELSDLAAHSFFVDGAVAVDLAHGRDAAQILVQRTFRKDTSGNGPFGRGWFDANIVELTQDNKDRVTITRNGQTLATATSNGNVFQTSDGATVTQSGDGWQIKTRRGTQLVFNTLGKMTSARSPSGQLVTYGYDSRGLLTDVKHGDKSFLRYTYDGSNDRVLQIDGPETLSCKYEYDARGFLGAVTNSRGLRVEYEYGAEGNLTTVKDQFGRSTDVPVEEEELTEFAATKKRMGLQPPKPVYKRNDQGQIVEQQHRGVTTKYAYNSEGRLSTISNPTGEWRGWYDDFDRVTKIATPTQTLSITYDKFDNVTRIESSDGRWRTVKYDDHGRPTDWRSSSEGSSVVDYGPTGETALIRLSPSWGATFAYDDHLRLSNAKLWSGREVDFGYDAEGRVASRKWSTGESQTSGYDSDGQLVESTFNGLKTNYEYDDDGLLTKINDPVFGKRTVDYSELENGQLSLTWEGLGTWTHRVNAWMQPVMFRRPSGQTTRYEYDERGLLFALTSPSDRTWKYEHDRAGRLTGILGTGKATTKLSRTDKGRIERVERSGITYREYVHGPDGRLRLESSPLGMAAAYTYDKVGRLKEVMQPDGKFAYGYNKFGLVESVKGAKFEIRQEFHDDGSLARRTYDPASLDLRLPLDDKGRPGGISLNGVTAQYVYGDDGRLEHIVLPKDIAITITRDKAGRPINISSNAVKLSLTFDQLNRLTSIGAAGPKREVIFLEKYEYDAAGNLVHLQPIGSPPREMQYDRDDRLVRVISGDDETEFVYSADDDLQSITTGDNESIWRLDNAGRPRMRDFGIIYDWDEAGNLTGVQSEETDAQNQFDAAGRLLSRTIADLEWHFGYLPSGDRLWQDGPSGKIWYAYLSSGLVGFKDEEGVAWLLVTMPGTDWPLALCGSNGTTYMLVADRLGSIRRVVDMTGKTVAHSDYGAYGELNGAHGFAPLNLYAGMVCDEHGLYYARQRYYDPLLCRFISLDSSIGTYQIPASYNAFHYAANNPYRYRDNLGRQPTPVEGEDLNDNVQRGRPALSDRIAAFLEMDPTTLSDKQFDEMALQALRDQSRIRDQDKENYYRYQIRNGGSLMDYEPLPTNWALINRVIGERKRREEERNRQERDADTYFADSLFSDDPVTSNVTPTKGDDSSRSPSPVTTNPAVKKMLKDFNLDIFYSRPFWRPNGTGGTAGGSGFQDILNQVRGLKQTADDAFPDDVTGYSGDSFDRLDDDAKRLKQRVDDIKDKIGTGDFQEVLDLAKKARETICGIVARGYRAADAPRLQREADALLAKARAADETNRKLLAAQRQAKELRDQVDKVKRPLDDLQKLADARKRFAPNQQRFNDQWDRVLRSIGDDQQRAFDQIDNALGANTIAKILQVGRLPDIVPDNADEILKSARDALKDAEDVLKKIGGEDDEAKKKRDDTLARHSEASTHIFEAQKCRGRIFGSPSTTPLTGNITADFLRALNPLAFKLRPRHAKSLTPDCPLDPHGHPAGPKDLVDNPKHDDPSDANGKHPVTTTLKGIATSFVWKQNKGLDTATVTFTLNGREGAILRQHGLPATVTVTAKRSGKNFIVPASNPLSTAISAASANLSRSVGGKPAKFSVGLTFTPSGKGVSLQSKISVGG